MNDLAAVISQAKTTEAKIRHAEQGYTGISPANRIRKAELNNLYEYDLALINGVRGLGDLAQSAFSSADAGDFDSVQKQLREIRSGFTDFTVTFDKRIVDIAEIGAF
jgi:hypothetical protein